MNECKSVPVAKAPHLHNLIERLSEIRAALSGEADATTSAVNRLRKNEDPSLLSSDKLIDANSFSTALEQELQLLTNVLERLSMANRNLHDLI
jgi:hypothetical protein